MIASLVTGERLFHRVKHVRKLERVIEDIRESGASSYRREWSYLWEKIQDLFVQDREDSNAQSVLKSLQSATPAKKTKAVPPIDGGNVSPPAAPSKAAPPKTASSSSSSSAASSHCPWCSSAQCESKSKGES